MDRGLISENRGTSLRNLQTRPRVDFGKIEGLLCKMSGDFRPGIIFQRINPWTGRVCSVHHGTTPAWTDGTVARSPELGLRPLRGPEARRAGAQKREGDVGKVAAAMAA
jgi:hypothetical protein